MPEQMRRFTGTGWQKTISLKSIEHPFPEQGFDGVEDTL
jgi:hypothetical protein